MSMVTSGGALTADTSEMILLNRILKAYIQTRYKKTEDQILTDKGNSLRIELFRAFWKRRWLQKKSGKTISASLRSILKTGGGIKVRLQSLIAPWDARVPQVDKNGKKLSLRQKLVAQEILRRISGSGILGISFLGKRWRFNKTGNFLVANKTNALGTAATFEKRNGEYVITGFTPGLGKIAERYGVIREALSEVRKDMEVYLTKHLGPDLVEALKAR